MNIYFKYFLKVKRVSIIYNVCTFKNSFVSHFKPIIKSQKAVRRLPFAVDYTDNLDLRYTAVRSIVIMSTDKMSIFFSPPHIWLRFIVHMSTFIFVNLSYVHLYLCSLVLPSILVKYK